MSTTNHSLETAKKQQIERRIHELKVLQSEMSSLKKGKKVYQQQPNSRVLFMQDAPRVFSNAKKELDDLIMEYEACSKDEAAEGEGEIDAMQAASK